MTLDLLSRRNLIKLTIILFLGFFLFLTTENISQPEWFNQLEDEDQHGLFTVMRFLMFLGFALLAYEDFHRRDKTLSIVWAASAVIINPIIQAKLGVFIWHILDWSWIVFISATIVSEIPKSIFRRLPHYLNSLMRKFGKRVGQSAENVYDATQRTNPPHDWAWDRSDTNTVLGCAVWFIVMIVIVGVVNLVHWVFGLFS